MNKYASFKKRPSRKLVFGMVGLLLIIGVWLVSRPRSSSSSQTLGSSSVSVAPSRYSIDISREFQFPIHDAQGKEVSSIKYFIKNAELRNEIIVKGQKVSSVSGRTFLVLSIKLTNELENDIEISTRDYVRLQINGSSEHLAADVHNDPVQVAAIATKETRLAFPVNDDLTQDFVLRVGEIKGHKEELPIKFN